MGKLMRFALLRKLPALLIGGLLLAAVVGALIWWLREPPVQYRTVMVERGTIASSVTASGTLAATVQVSVGSQISGQLREVRVDFNTPVRTGDLLARISPETFEYRLNQARADLEAVRAQVAVQEATRLARQADVRRAEVNLAEADRELQRREALFRQNFISEAELQTVAARARLAAEELNTARAQLEVANAQVRNAKALVAQREAAVQAAEVDLRRTEIRAPVDGLVIKRSVEPGQTVAASLQAPELFVIAQDLTSMQVETAVDESEIGRIRVGQPATFTVDAFPGRLFEGQVQQVRKAALNVSNVITYTVIIRTANPELLLVPGMTASVRIVTEQRDDVFKVPNAALRFRPPGEDTAAMAGGARPAGRGGRASRLFVQQADGSLRAIAVELGITDGSMTEVRGEGLSEGLAVISGVASEVARSSGIRAPRLPF
jgi:HlyD family secretion protein